MKTNDTLTLELRVKVQYDLNGTNPDKLKDKLILLAEDAYGDGRITGGYDAEVACFSFTVDEVKNEAD